MSQWLKSPTMICTSIGCFVSAAHLAMLLIFVSDFVALPSHWALPEDVQALMTISCPLLVVGPSAGCLFATLVQQWKL